MQQIRIHRPGVRHERSWHKALPPDSRDPDVVGAKAYPLLETACQLVALLRAAFHQA